MASPFLLDLTHTSHTRARTGVQRVARALYEALEGNALPVCFDPYERHWRALDGWEKANLAAPGPGAGRRERWPMRARARGLLRRWSGQASTLREASAPGVIVPEIFSPAVAAALPRLFSAARGPRVALFHDAIALQHPEHSPAATVARFPGYLRELLSFDGVAANSAASRDALVGFWRWAGIADTPPVTVLALGVDPPPTRSALTLPAGPPMVLCVGTLEGRKNHAALLDACEALWASGVKFNLRLIGLANSETGAAALHKLKNLQASGRPIRYDGPVGDQALEEAYAQCAFTVYPSVAEGFGLPVAESLARGKPCVCRADGALGEIARGGGCASLASGTAAEISGAIGELIGNPARLADLEKTASKRRFGTWSDYAQGLLGWMASLPRRS